MIHTECDCFIFDAVGYLTNLDHKSSCHRYSYERTCSVPGCTLTFTHYPNGKFSSRTLCLLHEENEWRKGDAVDTVWQEKVAEAKRTEQNTHITLSSIQSTLDEILAELRSHR